MATGLRIIALTEPEYQALKAATVYMLAHCADACTQLTERAHEHVRAAVYHPVPAKPYEIARTDQQHNIKRIRNR